MSRQRLYGLEQKVDRIIRQKSLLASEDSIVVAVSGGPDSVALIRCLAALRSRWNWEVSIGHINHEFRGEESEKDMAFVEGLAKSLGVQITVLRVPFKKAEPRFRKQSLQEVARNLRYEGLQQIVRESNATKLALGHTEDDQAETVLMWMLRGSGTGGLGGIPPQRGGFVVRPLLDIPRHEIQAYLKERQMDCRMDSSNLQPLYLRNRVRQTLLPGLKTFSPGIVKVLSRQAQLIRDDHGVLESMAHEHFEKMRMIPEEGVISLEKKALLTLPISLSRRIVRIGIQRLSGTSRSPRFDLLQRVIERLTHGQSGWGIMIHGIKMTQEYDQLVFRRDQNDPSRVKSNQAFRELSSEVPGEVVWPFTGERLTLWCGRDDSSIPVLNPQTQMYCDMDTFTPKLRWRRWEAGDVFCPKGMGGKKKKLQDFFSDIKLPRPLRSTIPLLVAPEGIIWVAGLRGDERFQVSPHTSSVLGARISAQPEPWEHR